MEKFGFFNSINSDRVYDASDFASFFKGYFTNGVFNDGLAVKASSDMSIEVSPGNANIEGYGYSNSESNILTCSTADGVNSRIDNVVVRLDLDERKISVLIVDGNPSSSVIAPSPVRTDKIYDLVVAQITIPAGTSKITNSMIKDTRFDEKLCGNVVGAVKQIETKDVFLQYEDMFNQWFANLKNQLDNNQATNLQNQIDKINEKLEKAVYFEEVETIEE